MRSRAARLTWGAGVLAVFGAAAFFLIQTEKQINTRRADVRAFDLHTRETSDALSDVRASQQAYVAAGQGAAFWMPKVASLVETAARSIDELRRAATSNEAKEALAEAAAAVAEFGNVDKRAREYLGFGEQLMASDVVFTEGGETAVTAARRVEVARLAERQALDAAEAAQRKLQASVLGGAGVLAVLVVGLLAFAVPGAREAGAHSTQAEDGSQEGDLTLRDMAQRPSAGRTGSPGLEELPRQSLPALKAAAELCTEFGRVNDLDDLTNLLGRASTAMDARGLIVWVGSTSGADLRPVLAHGYPPQALARMPPVPRSADNAAAKAYRTGALQIVLARPGTSDGAVVAPLLSPDGCIGALTAEIRGGGETADSVQALAAIFAAQLAGVLAMSAAAPEAEHRAAGSASL